MSHFREAIAKTKSTKDLLEVAMTATTPAEAQIFVTEAASYAYAKAGEEPPKDRSKGEDSIKEIVCRAASKLRPELLPRMEELFNYKLQPERPTMGELLNSLLGGSVVVLGGECPGCPNCQGDVIDVEGYTVSEEPPSAGHPRQLPPKSR